MKNLPALEAVEKFLADIVVDSVKASGDSNSAQKLAEYSNLLPDALALLPSLSDMVPEVTSLQPADFAALIADLAIDLAVPAGRVANIIQASLKFLQNILLVTVPDIEGIIAAAKS